MTRTAFLALTAVLAFTVPAQAETVTIVKTGEIVTQSYTMPSAPVAGDTNAMTSTTTYRKTPPKVVHHSTTKDDVIEWRDSQPMKQPRHKLAKPVENSHKLIRTYNQ